LRGREKKDIRCRKERHHAILLLQLALRMFGPRHELQKGQVKALDEGYVYLGRSQACLKNYAEAKKAFAGLNTVPNISPRVLKLWELYADTLGR
jgi:hypothetical protein